MLAALSITGIVVFWKSSRNKDKPVYADRSRASASVSTDANKNDSDNYTYIPPTYEYDNNNEYNEEGQMPDTTREIDLDPNSITVFVNQEHSLPKDFVPENLVIPAIPFDIISYSERKLLRLEAAQAIEKLFSAALKEGYSLYGISGYRSYDRQKEIFLDNIVKKGKEHTLKYSAAPGTSEHQTGLAMDVSSKSVNFKLVPEFAKTAEGKWLAHAHEYGFIIRYPKDHYEITGYAYEPWHIRYVGEI